MDHSQNFPMLLARARKFPPGKFSKKCSRGYSRKCFSSILKIRICKFSEKFLALLLAMHAISTSRNAFANQGCYVCVYASKVDGEGTDWCGV